MLNAHRNRVLEEAESLYVPLYLHPPHDEISFEELLKITVHRYRFHQFLKFDENEGILDYTRYRTLSLEYEIPFRESKNDIREIVNDNQSFFGLLMVSQDDPDRLEEFIKGEANLIFHRMKIGSAKISQVDDKLFPNDEIRKILKSDAKEIDFEKIMALCDTDILEIKDGKVMLTSDTVYSMLSRQFESILRERASKIKFKDKEFVDLLRNEFEREIKPEDEVMITNENYQKLTARSAPPCMYRIIDSLQKSHYLSPKGRFELCMFLKGLGFDYFDQYHFWKANFENPKSPDSFNRQIVPSLKYIYCVDGNRKKYQPHGCLALIGQDSPENAYQVQGCPFRYMMRAELKMFLRKMGRGLPGSVINEIALQVPEHPQIACKLFFDAIHPDRPYSFAGVSHPIQFFKESEARIRETEEEYLAIAKLNLPPGEIILDEEVPPEFINL